MSKTKFDLRSRAKYVHCSGSCYNMNNKTAHPQVRIKTAYVWITTPTQKGRVLDEAGKLAA